MVLLAGQADTMLTSLNGPCLAGIASGQITKLQKQAARYAEKYPSHKLSHAMDFLWLLERYIFPETPKSPERLCSDSGESKGLLGYVGTLERLQATQ